MELLHVGSELGSIDCQIKRLEEKINTSKPVEIMKEIHSLDDRIRHFSGIEVTSNKAVSALKELDETVDSLGEKLKERHAEILLDIKNIEAKISDKCYELVSKINDVNNRVDKLEKKIDTTISELRSEMKKSTFFRKLFWFD